ncbi:MAG: hypothetical protein ACI4HI_13405 [Lachnospiraceae bacterium]
MRSKTSFFNQTVFRRSIRHLWPVWSGYFLFLLVVMPVQLVAKLSIQENIGTKIQREAQQIRSLYQALHLGGNEILLAAVSVISAVLVFSYLFKQNASNMLHAFPLDRKELFFSNYFAGLFSLWIPQILAFFIVMFFGFVFEMPQIEFVAYAFLLMAGQSFLYYSMAVVCCMLAGQAVVVPFFFVGLNFFYAGTKFIVYQLIMAVSFGLNHSLVLNGKEFLSPLYCILSSVGIRLKEDPMGDTCSMQMKGTQYMIFYFFIAFAFVWMAYAMYGRRKLDYAGDMICIPKLKPLLRWGTAFFCGEFSAAFFFNLVNEGYWGTVNSVQLLICVFVVGILVFFGMEMFLEKTIRIFNKKRFVEAAVLGVFLVGTFFFISMDPFGMEKWTPDVQDVKKAYVSFWETDLEKDPSGIENIIRLQKQLIEKKDQIVQKKKKDYISNVVEFRYLMKDGTFCTRHYEIYTKQNVTSLKQKPTDEAEQILYEIFKRATTVQQFMQSNFCENYEEMKVDSVSLNLYDSGNLDEVNPVAIPKKWMNDLILAVEEDIKNGADSSYEEGGDSSYWYLNDLEIDFHTKNAIQDAMADFYAQDDISTEENLHKGTACILLNKGYTRTIQFLCEHHIIANEDRLITENNYNEKTEVMQEE